jgi:hypothetical protein
MVKGEIVRHHVEDYERHPTGKDTDSSSDGPDGE